MGICDICSTMIALGEGYLVYSSLEIAGLPFGAMHLCEKCANELFTQKVWSEAQHFTGIGSIDPMGVNAREELKQANYLSIANRAVRRGLSPYQARQEARDIAQLWWKDEKAAVQRLLAQSSSSKVDTESDTPKRRWWQFWE